MKKSLLKLAYKIINRYDKNRVVAKESGMIITDPVNIFSPTKSKESNKFLNSFE